MTLLERILSPPDLRKLSLEELTELAGDIRRLIFDSVSRNGGHLASNLGIVELTLALHYVYDFGPYPQGQDRLLFDVGHQCYPHKILTGRAGQFDQLRKRGSISGFPSPRESAYDLFAVGHAGTAISTAVGMARGDDLMGRESHVVAVVGDGSIANGLAFEGLNAAGTVKRQLMIVLNDNGMSISKPQGAFAGYLERIRISQTYDEAKKIGAKIVHRLPSGVEQRLETWWHSLKGGIKSVMWPDQIFEALGLKYMGPIDGHDLPMLIAMLGELKDLQAPVLLHVKTTKGQGYEVAASEPTKFHSPSPFKVQGDEVVLNGPSGRSWTAAFADAMIALAEHDSRVVTLTAAMPDGTGLSKFELRFPTRCIDAGICESHVAAMAAGMCKSGLRPFVAIYSTFMQRAFDQVWQEVALNNQAVVFCMDRAGFVGDDGAIHHGFSDQAFLRPLPGMVLMAPSDEAELNRCLRLALRLESPSAIRYPRDAVPAMDFEHIVDEALREQAAGEWRIGQSRTLREGEDATIIAYGALTMQAMNAAAELEAEGLSVGVVDARFCKPLDGPMLQQTLRPGHAVLTVEDHALQNGFGSAVLEYAVAKRLPTQCLTRQGIPDRLVAHATRKEQLAEVGLNAAGIARSARDAIRLARAPTSVEAAG